MQKRVRCPLCGFLYWQSQIEKYHNIDVKSMEPRGRARGFRYTDSEDLGLVALVKAKVRSLYEKYFGSVTPPVTVAPGIRARGDVPLRPNLLIMPGVRIVE